VERANRHRVKGAAATSYGLALGLITIIALSAVEGVGTALDEQFTSAGIAMSGGSLGGCTAPDGSEVERGESFSGFTRSSALGPAQCSDFRITGVCENQAMTPDVPHASCEQQIAPSLSVSHTLRQSDLTVTLSGGAGLSGCAVEAVPPSGTPVTLGPIACNGEVTESFSLPDPFEEAWDQTDVRVTMDNGATVLDTRSNVLRCPTTNIQASQTSTPTIDENCDGAFDQQGTLPILINNPTPNNNSRPIRADDFYGNWNRQRFCVCYGGTFNSTLSQTATASSWSYVRDDGTCNLQGSGSGGSTLVYTTIACDVTGFL